MNKEQCIHNYIVFLLENSRIKYDQFGYDDIYWGSLRCFMWHRRVKSFGYSAYLAHHIERLFQKDETKEFLKKWTEDNLKILNEIFLKNENKQ